MAEEMTNAYKNFDRQAQKVDSLFGDLANHENMILRWILEQKGETTWHG